MAGKLEKRAEKISRIILKTLAKAGKPLTTRAICQKTGRAWHSIQTHCLRLQIAGKVHGYRISNLNIWELKQESKK